MRTIPQPHGNTRSWCLRVPLRQGCGNRHPHRVWLCLLKDLASVPSARFPPSWPGAHKPPVRDGREDPRTGTLTPGWGREAGLRHPPATSNLLHLGTDRALWQCGAASAQEVHGKREYLWPRGITIPLRPSRLTPTGCCTGSRSRDHPLHPLMPESLACQSHPQHALHRLIPLRESQF